MAGQAATALDLARCSGEDRLYWKYTAHRGIRTACIRNAAGRFTCRRLEGSRDLGHPHVLCIVMDWPLCLGNAAQHSPTTPEGRADLSNSFGFEEGICQRSSVRILQIYPLALHPLTTDRATFFSGWSYIALVVDIPERLQIVNGDTSLVAGLHLLPLLGATAFGSFAAGIINKKNNLTAYTTIAGCGFQCLGLGLIYGTTSGTTSIALFLGYTTIYGLGVGLVFAGVTMMTTVEARNIDLAVAQGAVAQARVLGGCIGLTVGTLVFNRLVQEELSTTLDNPQLEAIHRSPMAIFSMPEDLQPVVTRVYIAAFTWQMLGLLIISVIGLLTSLGTLLSDRTPVASLLAQHLQPQKSGSARTSDMELGDVDRRFTARPARVLRLPSSASRGI